MTALTVDDPLADALGALPAIGLARIEDVAALRTRIDRKYVVTPELMGTLVDAVAGRCSVLEIDGRRTFRYESRYFDSDDLVSYRRAAHDRPDRFKVRTRVYRDQGICALEVKTRGTRGETVKERLPYDLDDDERLTLAGRRFVEAQTRLVGLGPHLHPVLTTGYRRSTLVDETDGSRTTIDQDLVCTDRSGRGRPLPHHVVLETKSVGAATAVDRLLWRRGARPVRISKFCVGMALHDPTLPANRWNRVLRTYFGWTPAPRA